MAKPGQGNGNKGQSKVQVKWKFQVWLSNGHIFKNRSSEEWSRPNTPTNHLIYTMWAGWEGHAPSPIACESLPRRESSGTTGWSLTTSELDQLAWLAAISSLDQNHHQEKLLNIRVVKRKSKKKEQQNKKRIIRERKKRRTRKNKKRAVQIARTHKRTHRRNSGSLRT